MGVLALALILYFSLAALAPTPCVAGLWLLPLTVSFLLQPHGRGVVGRRADARRISTTGTPTRARARARDGRAARTSAC